MCSRSASGAELTSALLLECFAINAGNRRRRVDRHFLRPTSLDAIELGLVHAVLLRVRAQDFGCVVLGIEGNRDA